MTLPHRLASGRDVGRQPRIRPIGIAMQPRTLLSRPASPTAMVGEGQIWPWREALSWPAVCIAAIFATLYGTACGRGFISDDYAWIRHGRFDDLSDVAHIFSSSVGFYRPLVSLSFGLNFHLFGLSPYGYGLTNLALALVCGIGVVALSREMRLPPRSAATAAAPIEDRRLSVMPGAGASSMIFWCRRCIEQSRSKRCTPCP